MKYIYAKAGLLALFIFSSVIANAQQFKWVTGGGTNYNFSVSGDWEQVKYMCTDPNGNVYALSQVGPNAIYADTFYQSGAYGATNNILLTSYTCNGQMRWAKLIASSGGPCEPDGLKADSLGHVYLSGWLHSGTLHIGSDTTIGVIDQAAAVIQYDIAGHFHWIRYVGDNTPPSFYNIGWLGCSLALDGSNNVHFLNYIETGVHITPTLTSVYGTYDITYAPSGSLLSATRLDLDSPWSVDGAVIDPVTNKLYAYGELNVYIYGGMLTDTFFAAAFDANRNRLWQHFAGHGDDDGLTGIVMDGKRNLLFSGAAQPHYAGHQTTFSFNGDSTYAPYDDLGIIMKTDTNGTVKWFVNTGTHNSVDGFNGITLLQHDKVACIGTYAGTVYSKWDSLTTPAADGWTPYLIIVDSSGDIQTMQQAYGDGFYNEGTAITSDRIGNIYFGGLVTDSIWPSDHSVGAYHSVGGNTDFFLMKDGVDCNCTAMPIAAYTDTGHHTVGVTYTGTTTGIDSVVWNFGDTTALITGITALHTYVYYGTYRVCATVYTSCGNDIYCTDVRYQSTTGMPALSQNEIQVFPNPSNEILNITGIRQTTNYRLFSVTGTCVSQGQLQQQPNVVSMKELASGVYILEMTGEDGQRNIVRVVKG